MNGKPFSDSDKELVKQNYRTKGCRWCASQIGRTISSVYALASKLELTEQRVSLSDSVVIDAIRELHPKGFSDTEVVNHLTEKYQITTDRHRVGVLRRELNLQSNALSEHRRKKVSEKTKSQLEVSGFEHLAALRVAQWNAWKRSLGWPETLTVRAVQALECFWQLGHCVPITRLQLCSMMGIESTCRTDPKSNAKGGTVLAELERAGFIERVHRGVSQSGEGKCNVNFYYLKQGVEKGDRGKQENNGGTKFDVNERAADVQRTSDVNGLDPMASDLASSDGQFDQRGRHEGDRRSASEKGKGRRRTSSKVCA